jgi:hypothetical protein
MIRTNYGSCFTAHKQKPLSKRSGINLTLILNLAMSHKICNAIDDPLLPFGWIEAAFMNLKNINPVYL